MAVALIGTIVGSFAVGRPADVFGRRKVLFAIAVAYFVSAVGCGLARFVLDRLVPDGPVQLVGDDTVDGHKGPRVYGKGRHRDPVRSTHTYTAWRYGHRWVVLAVLVKFPFAARRWALPVLVDLYRPPEVSAAGRRRSSTRSCSPRPRRRWGAPSRRRAPARGARAR